MLSIFCAASTLPFLSRSSHTCVRTRTHMYVEATRGARPCEPLKLSISEAQRRGGMSFTTGEQPYLDETCDWCAR